MAVMFTVRLLNGLIPHIPEFAAFHWVEAGSKWWYQDRHVKIPDLTKAAKAPRQSSELHLRWRWWRDVFSLSCWFLLILVASCTSSWLSAYSWAPTAPCIASWWPVSWWPSPHMTFGPTMVADEKWPAWMASGSSASMPRRIWMSSRR